ncbi:hypothetical protein BVH01_08145 [Pseudomonas sp. PA1(2017)]|uniref:hypothetical protein n=1 Tax=Pseudomonas sp. PA1(2017) TaxID=1932113 RepID=UPI0009615F23|nr:hypothetical protein [Pseudomonas sp. PA1(2017)]OLU16553.1 hypothetical protein BVH01_08145 [Pseudomonas sp. PA1(2017)]
MQSSADVFADFINWLLSLDFFSEDDLAEILEEFDGVKGVIKSGLYISAYEEVARYMACDNSLEDAVLFLGANCKRLEQLPGEQYYFFESLVDAYSASGADVLPLINASSERYRGFLMQRFVR